MISFERIAVSRAADKTAAQVTGKGEHWEPRKPLVKPCDAWRDTPLPLARLPEGTPSLAGLRAGRLTVVGYGGPGSGGARWVVRCTCGAYEHQKAKALTGDYAPRAMCPHCAYLERLKSGQGHPLTPDEVLEVRRARAERKAAKAAERAA